MQQGMELRNVPLFARKYTFFNLTGSLLYHKKQLTGTIQIMVGALSTVFFYLFDDLICCD